MPDHPQGWIGPLPKLFHSLRSSRQTELAEKYPIHVVCAWIGNSQAIAKDHYLQVTDAHFEQAAKCDDDASAKPTEQPAQNAAQQAAESTCTEQSAAKSLNEKRPVLPGDSTRCEKVQLVPVGAVGTEHAASSLGIQAVSSQSGTESGTVGGDSGFADAVAAVMRLPLSDSEKAEAVRRLLAGKGVGK